MWRKIFTGVVALGVLLPLVVGCGPANPQLAATSAPAAPVKEPVVVKADLGTKGIFYRIRLVGFDTQSDANSECSRLKSKGVKCYISKAAS